MDALHHSSGLILADHQCARWVSALRRAPAPLRALAAVMVIFTLAYASLALTRHLDGVAVLWAPNAFAAAVILVTKTPNRSQLLLGTFTGISLANMAFGNPLWIAISFAAINLFQIQIIYGMYRIIMQGHWPTDQLRHYIRFQVYVVLPSAVLSAVPAAFFISYAFETPLADAFTAWVLNEAVNISAFFALTLICLSRRHERVSLTNMRLAISLGTILVIEAILTLALFTGSLFMGYFMIVPIVAIAALLHGRGGTIIVNAALLVSMAVEGVSFSAVQLGPIFSTLPIWTFSIIYFCIEFPATLVAIVTDTLRRSETVANEASQSKTDFISMMSHEMLTPLNIISGMFQLLAHQDMPARAKNHVETGQSATASFEVLIRQFLTVCELEDGTLSMNRQRIQPEQVMDFWQKNLSTLIRNSGKNIEVTVENNVSDETWIIADPARLAHILSNLGNNAVKFSDNGQIRLCAYQNGETITFRIIDQGHGIEPGDLSHVFDRYWQVERGAARSADGAGLGLAIAHEMATLMGGQLDVESEPGKGAAFSVTFLVDQNAPLAQVLGTEP